MSNLGETAVLKKIMYSSNMMHFTNIKFKLCVSEKVYNIMRSSRQNRCVMYSDLSAVDDGLKKRIQWKSWFEILQFQIQIQTK